LEKEKTVLTYQFQKSLDALQADLKVKSQEISKLKADNVEKDAVHKDISGILRFLMDK
jgi:hypothetical protein